MEDTKKPAWPTELESVNRNLAEGRELLRRAMVRLEKLKKKPTAEPKKSP